MLAGLSPSRLARAKVRVHDVAATVDYLTVRAALMGERPVDSELRLDDALRREPRSLKAES